jgi:hypothetical protein
MAAGAISAVGVGINTIDDLSAAETESTNDAAAIADRKTEETMVNDIKEIGRKARNVLLGAEQSSRPAE